MSGAEYQAEFNQQVTQGLYPICTQGGGSTASPVYAAIFAKQDIPSTRTWTIAGSAVPSLAPVDQLMETLMRANAIRAAQVAIARDGVIKFSRGYPWAEPGYRETQPTDRFLLASCSKMFLEAVVQALYDAKQLTPSTKVYPLLGFKNPLDPRSDTITIQQLLDHAGGYDDSSAGSGFDPTYHMRDIGVAQGHAVSSKLDVAHYMYGKMLDFTPGTKSFPQVYSNYGYLLAGAVVEHVTGKSYYQYVNSALLQPVGISEVRVISTLASGRSSDEAIAEDQGLGLNPLNLSSQLLEPNVYGGDGEINEVGDPNDGMGASAEVLARFINFHAVFGNGPRSPGASRIGSTPGGYTQAGSRADGVDWAYVLNTRDWTPSAKPTTNDLVNVLNTVPVP
jgi:CubicO group peptidase (beta-lactamase class C family)